MSVFKKTKGFTIIELIVVIAIIILLTAIVILAINNHRGKAKDIRVKSDFGQLRVIAEAIYAESGSYSSLCDGGNFNKNQPVFGADLAMLEADLEKFVEEGYSVECLSTGTNYCFSAYLPGENKLICMDYSGSSFEEGVCMFTGDGYECGLMLTF